MKNTHRVALAATVVALLSACAVEPSPYAYQPQPEPYPAERGRVVAPVAANTGVVSSVQVLREPGGNGISPGGAILGAVVGGLLGNQVGAGGGKALATGAGVVGGALAGNAIGNRASTPQETYRIGIEYDGGGTQFIDVPHPGDLRVGDRVRVDGNQISRY